MLERLVVATLLLGLVEVVHVQLADEAAEVVVLEVLRQDLLAKRYGIADSEAVAIGLGPVGYVVRTRVVYDLVELDQKTWHVVDRIGDTLALTWDLLVHRAHVASVSRNVALTTVVLHRITHGVALNFFCLRIRIFGACSHPQALLLVKVVRAR